MAEAPGKCELAQLEISVATYTDDVETPEHALAWEEHLRQPDVWSEEEESLYECHCLPRFPRCCTDEILFLSIYLSLSLSMSVCLFSRALPVALY